MELQFRDTINMQECELSCPQNSQIGIELQRNDVIKITVLEKNPIVNRT